jgi:hypothetical protein
MKTKRREADVFSLSFLDVISCGFGAVILLVLISKYELAPSPGIEKSSLAMLEKTLDLETQLQTKLDRMSKLRMSIDQQSRRFETAKGQLAKETASLTEAKDRNSQNRAALEGLSTVLASLRRSAKAGIAPKTMVERRNDQVGGIPVDSDYVLFILDTSGSMKTIWPRVMREVENILRIHPKVIGFQVLNDNGAHLLTAYQGRWIPDTPARRKGVLNLLRGWNIASNSSPVEGLKVALTRYASKQKKMSIYIFGDEYSGSSYDPVLATLDRLNTNRVSGGRLSRVHAIGFISNYSTSRFATLMREVTYRNNGSFVALPR